MEFSATDFVHHYIDLATKYRIEMQTKVVTLRDSVLDIFGDYGTEFREQLRDYEHILDIIRVLIVKTIGMVYLLLLVAFVYTEILEGAAAVRPPIHKFGISLRNKIPKMKRFRTPLRVIIRDLKKGT